VQTVAAALDAPMPLLTRLACAAFGHQVDNRRFRAEGDPDRPCPCGRACVRDDGSETRVRHTLSCFLGSHTYELAGTRDGHNEYMCADCGHPLLFAVDSDPYGARPFAKKVRYLCNLFGHDVHVVARRHGCTEYACACGHSFLKSERDLARVTHPPICTVAGHFVRFVERRGEWSEHACRNCGHTLGFAGGR
jgi:hypothetical protein